MNKVKKWNRKLGSKRSQGIATPKREDPIYTGKKIRPPSINWRFPYL